MQRAVTLQQVVHLRNISFSTQQISRSFSIQRSIQKKWNSPSLGHSLLPVGLNQRGFVRFGSIMKKYRTEEKKEKLEKEDYEEGLETPSLEELDEEEIDELLDGYMILTQKKDEFNIIAQFPEIKAIEKQITDEIKALKDELFRMQQNLTFQRLQKSIQKTIDEEEVRFFEDFKKSLNEMPFEDLEAIHDRYQTFKVDEEFKKELESKPKTSEELQAMLFQGEVSPLGLVGGSQETEEENVFVSSSPQERQSKKPKS